MNSLNFLRILFLSSDKFPPYRVDVSVLFGKEIINKGHVIDWVLQSEKPLEQFLETDWHGGRAFVAPTVSPADSPLKIAKLYFLSIYNDLKMFSRLKKKSYDIIIIKDKFISSIFALIASKIFSIKFVYWLSFPFPEDSFFKVKEKAVKYPLLYSLRGVFFYIILYKIILRYCDHAFVQTEYMKSNIAHIGIAPNKMSPVPMAVSIDDIPFYGYGQNNNFTKKSPSVVYLGTLVKIRRMEFLLRAFKLVLTKKPDALLYLVGGSEVSSDEKDLRLEAQKLGIDHSITITGLIPQRQAWQYVENADVCVSPIYPSPIFDVGSPTKLLEYMAMGKASVANDHPEQRFVIEESGAGVCVPYDETAFANAILHLLDNQHIAREMGIKGRKYIVNYRNYTLTSAFVEKKLLDIFHSN